ncbi:MAG: DUF2238 domain-containing protein [Proteobacteria bacterium]|jgi:putative membrane protein|nr:DUF2238 domain-containing protein [Pseudomonadota bacterium]MDA1301491.1 DUF2238 domain-containing protein [Pseudomonadota bacterium]
MLLVVAGVWITHRYHQFSRTSFIMMGFLVVLHTIGGHYTFEHVPFGLITETFSFERNHFDRVAHFSVGFYAYPIAELLLNKQLVMSRVILVLFPLFAIVTVAGLYEVVEWQYAISADADAGLAVLGSQGDVWDAQKDITADTLGAVCALALFFLHHPELIRQPIASHNH